MVAHGQALTVSCSSVALPLHLRLRAFVAILVVVASDNFRYRAGACFPKMNAVRSNVVMPMRHNQQSAELWGLCWAVRLARRFGWHCLFLLTDSQAATNQLVHLWAETWLDKQMCLLRCIIIRMRLWGMVVRVHWVPTEL